MNLITDQRTYQEWLADTYEPDAAAVLIERADKLSRDFKDDVIANLRKGGSPMAEWMRALPDDAVWEIVNLFRFSYGPKPTTPAWAAVWSAQEPGHRLIVKRLIP